MTGRGSKPREGSCCATPDDNDPFSALAFKIMTDPFAGQLTYFRVYSGTLKTGTPVYNITKNTKERIGRLLKMHANKREDIDEVYAGDIAAAVGLKGATTGDTLCDEKHPVLLEVMKFPEPVISMAIEPKTKAGSGKARIFSSKIGAGRSVFPGAHRRRNRSDNYFRHGRVASGDHRRSH